MANVRIIGPEEAEGRLGEVYRKIAGSRGGIANVHTLQSLDPDSLVSHMDLYRTTVFGRSDLTRAQREMIAVVVSSANGCRYCTEHHIKALEHFWKDISACRALAENHASAGLSPLDGHLCALAEALTRSPGDMKDSIGKLEEHGLSQRGILDAVQVTAYFNYVNRLVLALGCGLEADCGGYSYD
jgi:uncharacterized peroxidase-related enzyme